MNRFLDWWRSGISPWIKLVYLVLMANAVPAFIILMSFPGQTNDLFVWTIKPEASARLLGVMYGNALLLVIFGLLQPNWERVRITLLLITAFSILATIVTFLHLGPFLQHPWFHLIYWLSMYLILFFVAPIVFVLQEREHGGKLPIETPLSPLARVVAAGGAVLCGLTGLGLFISPEMVSNFWPWNLMPLVGRILAVWFVSLAISYGWALWDGDWIRTRPIFWQAAPTGILLALLPLIHNGDVRKDSSGAMILFVVLALGTAIINSVVVFLSGQRAVMTRQARHGAS